MTDLSQTNVAVAQTSSAKEAFLDANAREHTPTVRVLRASPENQLELRPHPKCNAARGLAWVFAIERALGVYGSTADEPWM